MGNFDTLTKVYKFLKQYKMQSKIQLYVIIITVIITVISLLDPLIYKFLVEEFFLEKNRAAFFTAALLFFNKTLFFNIFTLAKQYLQVYLGFFLALKIRRRIFENIVGIKSEEEKKLNIGEVFVSFDSDVYEVENKLTVYLFELYFYVLQVFGIGIILLILSRKYFFIVVAIRVITIILNNKIWVKKLRKGFEKYKTENSKLFSFLSEAINNGKNIRVQSKEIYAERKFFKRVADTTREYLKYLKKLWLSEVFEQVLTNIDRIILWGVGGYLFHNGEINLGTYLALIVYEEILKLALKNIVGINVTFHPTIVAIERLEKIFELKKETILGKKIKKLNGEIEFKNIEFYYEDGEKIFDNFNFKIKQGEKVAIVGESGSGKTTLINLLLGLYKPAKGNIIVDNLDINKNLNIRSYRRRVGIVTQESFFFKGSLLENILMGEKIPRHKVERVLEMSQLKKVIEENPEGELMELELNGSNLSGGQKQRLSIARMLVRNPDIVILDEATSALDNITEAKIQDELEKELENKTVIMIAHRLSTIKNADRIIVLEAGKIIEEGTHEELVNNKNYYYRLLNKKDENSKKGVMV